MGSHTRIEWADKTYNPWIGCSKVSPACANCYAARFGKRRGIEWGPGKPRRRTKTAKDVRKWNRSAAGEQWAESPEIAPPSRPKVFVASLADWLDNEVPVAWLADLLALIVECPHLDFLLLTKRPEQWERRLLAVRDHHRRYETESAAESYAWLVRWLEDRVPPDNVWLGITAEDQRRLDERWPRLRDIPARVRFLSVEPMLGSLALPTCALGEICQCDGCVALGLSEGEKLHWVIAGGESGPGARPTHPDWLRSLRDQCDGVVPFFFKQWGAWTPGDQLDDGESWRDYMRRVGKKLAGRQLDGREWSEVPA